MQVAVRRDRVADPARRDELVERVGLGVLPLLGECPGFVAGCVVALDDGTVGCFHLWSDRVGAEAGARLVGTWIERHVLELVVGSSEAGLGEVREFEIGTGLGVGAGGSIGFAGGRCASTRKERHAMVQTATPTTTTANGQAAASAAPTQAAGRPGARVGTVAELTMIAPFKPGGAAQLREILQRTQPLLADAANRVGTLHDMRFVIIDNDTRLLFATTYDGDWDAYIDDFATKLAQPLDTHFSTLEGYPGIASPTIKDWIVQHQITAEGWFSAYPDATVRDIWKGQKVMQAFEALLDTASS